MRYGGLVTDYRLYRLNEAGHFKSGHVIQAETDRNAIVAALRELGSERGELWLEGRKLSLSL